MRNTAKKIIPYLLIVIVLLGAFNPATRALAVDGSGDTGPGATPPTETTPPEEKSEFENKLNLTCANPITNFSGCFLQVSYWLFHDIPALLLGISAYFFNILVSISLDGELLKSAFVSQAWGVVRDLSNIFFILILLYVAVKIILDLGGHEVKQTIAKVVIIALLINFSMFFTQVIIDTSNILALVFYNKMKVSTINPDGSERQYSSIKNEKDISGGLVASFDPTVKILGSDFFEQIEKKYDANGKILDGQREPIGFGTKLALIILSGAIMVVATYVLFVSGFFFLGRLIELWVLIIFSPFAFMSYTLPELSGIQDLGWQSWFKRLVSSAFMAPIFMFFMYFIFMLIASPLFKNIMPESAKTDGVTGWMKIILNVLLPFIFICVLLLKAKAYAKKGSGQFGEAVMSVSKVVGGLALGAATGGTSLLATKSIGAASNSVMTNYGEKMKEKSKEAGFTGWAARKALKVTDAGTKSTFDIRNTGIGKTLAKSSGMNLQSVKAIGLGSKEGGFAGAAKRKSEAVEEESKLHKTGKTDKEVEEWAKKNNIRDEKGNLYTKADKLNHDRMKAFQDNFGQSSLMGTVAYKYVKARGKIVDDKNWEDDKNKEDYKKQYAKKYGKEAEVKYDSGVAKEVNYGRIQTTKMVIGGTAAAVLTGGVGLASGAGILGATGVAAAGAGIGGYAATPSRSDRAGENKFMADHAKEEAKIKKITDKIEANTKALNELGEFMQGFAEQKDANGNPGGLVTKEEDGSFKLNTDKIEKRLADLNFEAKRENLRLEQLIKDGVGDEDPRMTSVREILFNNTLETGRLNRLNTAPEKIRNLNKQNHDLGKDKSAVEKEHESHSTKKPKDEDHDKGGHPPKAHGPEPSHEEPKAASSGGGAAHAHG